MGDQEKSKLIDCKVIIKRKHINQFEMGDQEKAH